MNNGNGIGFKLKKLEDGIDVSNFDCVSDRVNNFLKKLSKDYQKESLSITYVVMDNEIVVGYFSLATGSLTVRNKEFRKEVLEGYEMENYPGIMITWLGVDQDYEGHDYGEDMLIYIYEIALKIQEKVGCRFLIVRALPDAIKWWKKKGFEPLFGETGLELKWYFLDIFQMEEIIS